MYLDTDVYRTKTSNSVKSESVVFVFKHITGLKSSCQTLAVEPENNSRNWRREEIRNYIKLKHVLSITQSDLFSSFHHVDTYFQFCLQNGQICVC